MRRYTRKQVIVAFLAGMALVGLPSLVLNMVRTKGNSEVSTRQDVFKPDTPPVFVNVVAPSTPGGGTSEEQINIAVYEALNEAVVHVTTEVLRYNWFLEAVPREGASGSGSVIDKAGYVLTNSHVVENAFKVYVTLAGDKQYTGEVVGTDYESDLSIVKFDPKGEALVVIPFGRSAHLKVGQRVLAIGNPFALERTLSTGIVSGVGRPVRNKAGLIMQDMIQTDASINPGNSGGPLINTKGEMIGINTIIYSPVKGSIGIGFAIPVDTARRVIPDLIEYGIVKRGWIDIVPVQLFPALSRVAKLPTDKGILVSRLIPGGNADKAGIRGGDPHKAVAYGGVKINLGGDLIVGIGGQKVASLTDLYAALEYTKPGETIEVVFLRGRKKKRVMVTLSPRPQKATLRETRS